MIEVRQVLNFVPPRLDGDNTQTKRRYMIISNNDNKTIEMINISKVEGKEYKMFALGNARLKDFRPFKVPSFAKADTIYKIENFEQLEDFISFNGEKINEEELEYIFLKRNEYINKKNIVKVINFTKEEFLEKNPIKIKT